MYLQLPPTLPPASLLPLSRLDIKSPEQLVPQLPKPRDLQPFPTTLALAYEGHMGPVASIAPDPWTGQWLLSGGQDGTLRLWEVRRRRRGCGSGGGAARRQDAACYGWEAPGLGRIVYRVMGYGEVLRSQEGYCAGWAAPAGAAGDCRRRGTAFAHALAMFVSPHGFIAVPALSPPSTPPLCCGLRCALGAAGARGCWRARSVRWPGARRPGCGWSVRRWATAWSCCPAARGRRRRRRRRRRRCG